MTPQEKQMLEELYSWMQERKEQQITLPLDEASKNNLGALTDGGLGSTSPTRSQVIAATPTSITVPTNPIGSIIIDSAGARYEIPYLSTL